MSGPSMLSAVSSIWIRYDACMRNRLETTSSADLGSMSIGKPNKTLAAGQVSNSLENVRS